MNKKQGMINIYYMRKNINVRALMRSDGEILPLEIEWEDGRRFAIDRVLEIKKVASTKGGGKGLRYTCRILGQQRYLFLDEHFWFIEID